MILGIESSCDETAAAVVQRGSRQLSNVVASQIAIHSPYGGVVPELASREHLRAIVPVVEAAIREAGISMGGAGLGSKDAGFGMKHLDAIAVTEGPGLAGALLVGIGYAKALAYALGKPLIAVNHLEGHIHAVLLEHAAALPTAGPLLALVVSGGHTHLYLAQQRDATWHYRNVGHTVDDAAGEAFDKVAKLLGLGYPGGPWIDHLATHGNPQAVPFSFAQIKPKAHRPNALFTVQRAASAPYLFSFSGIKTAVLRYVETHNTSASIAARRQQLTPATKPAEAGPADALVLCDQQTLDLIASFQRAVVDDLKRKTFAAAEHYGAHALLVSGGVAANSELRARFTAEAAKRGLPIAFPALALSTDNAAMIAAAAWPKLLAGDFAPPSLSARASLPLGAEAALP
ncbi:MAG TPA: tRNA (adenosine(37)-N6)-threonylcarbamoyltransferase complex transferase subunit TsaD [Acidobacteriaceae bacterium]|nr:tRNA (adenosine(37)-N6)-threonylcarbamoyltransferase complex transferase subunit TsaD [Acidobacteriaceae bacterium]